jgi:hypothetical protein
VVLPIPDDLEKGDEDWIPAYEDMEMYFQDAIYNLTESSHGHVTLPTKFQRHPPKLIQGTIDELMIDWYNGDELTYVQVAVRNPATTKGKAWDTKWFQPVIVNNLRKLLRQESTEPDSIPLEGFEVCFISHKKSPPILMMVEHVLTSGDEDLPEDKSPFNSEHLTPLQGQLDESIQAATTVIRSLNLMERREMRMRKTADKINWRVRYFSYFSVLVLILVTFFQIKYLKRYFRKKKLL